MFNSLKKLFISEKIEPSHPRFASKDYVKTRTWYYAQCAFAYMIALTISDTFLAKYLHYMGITDSTIGIINAIINFSYLFSVLELLLIPKVKSLKKTVIIGKLISGVSLIPLFLIPFFPVSKTLQIILIFICIIISHLFNKVVGEFYTKWIYYFIDYKTRSTVTTINCSISYFVSIVYLLLCGFIVDHFEEKGKIEIAFICLAVLITLMTILSFISFLRMKNSPILEGETDGKTLKQTFNYFWKNKSYQRLVMLMFFETLPAGLLSGFLGTYKTQELGLSVGTIQIVNIFVVIIEGTLIRLFGQYADKTSPMHCLRLLFILRSVAYLIMVFTCPDTWWLMFAYMIVEGISVASGGGAQTTLCFEYLSNDYLVQCMAIKLCITGVLGFLVSLGAAKVLSFIQTNGLVIGGISIYGQQFLAFIALVISITAYFFSKYVEKKKNEKEIQGE